MQFFEIEEKSQLENLNSLLPTISIDTETSSLDESSCDLLRIIVADVDKAYSITPSLLLDTFSRVQPHRDIVLQNFKFDYKVLKRRGIDLLDYRPYDTIILEHLVDERLDHSLDSMVMRLYKDNYKSEFWNKYDSYQEADRKDQIEYECKDGVYTARIFQKYKKILIDQGRWGLAENVHRLAYSLAQTEYEGVRVDVPLILKTLDTMGKEISIKESKLRPLVAEYCNMWELNKQLEIMATKKKEDAKLRVKRPVFNFSSASQVQWLLYNQLNLPIIEKTDAGKPSVDYDTLEKLQDKHPVVKELKEYKGILTTYNTNVKGLLEKQKSGLIYPSLNVNGTKTGRISHSSPNLGNIPVDGVIRNFFIPNQGMSLIGADYTQLEVVLEANITQDPNLIKIITEGISKHDLTNDNLKLNDRNKAKTLNFAMQYWCEPPKVAEILKTTREKGKEIYDLYWRTYEGCRKYKRFTDSLVEQGRPVETLFKRRRHFDRHFKNHWEAQGAKRQAYNAVIQGTGADCCNISFYLFNEWLRENKYGRALWSVHDEILAEVLTSRAEECKEKLVEIMMSISEMIKLKYPLSAKSYGPFDKWQKT